MTAQFHILLLLLLGCHAIPPDEFKTAVKAGKVRLTCTFTISLNGNSCTAKKSKVSCTPTQKKAVRVNNALVKSDSGNSYKISMVISKSQQKITKCITTKVNTGSPPTTTSATAGSCCQTENGCLPVGSRIPRPEKCEYLVCKNTLFPTLVFESAHSSCSCCLGTDGLELHPEGANTLGSGMKVTCCAGHWVEIIDVTSSTTTTTTTTTTTSTTTYFGP